MELGGVVLGPSLVANSCRPKWWALDSDLERGTNLS
jgi:hypothetical protein